MNARAQGTPEWWDAPRRLEGLRGWRALAAAAGLGAVAALGHAPFHVFPAYALGLVGLVWLIDGAFRGERSGAAAFARGWAFGFGHFLAGLYWIGSAFLQVPDGWILMVPAVLALPAGLALFWGAATRVALPLWTSDARRIPALALCLALAELARGTVLTGFPWNLPGLIWPAGGAMSQTASLVGVYGLSALTLLVLAAPATLADAARQPGLGRRAAPTLAAALAFGLMWGYGAQRLATAPEGPLGPVVRVVDVGLTHAERWNPDGSGVAATFSRLLELTGAPEETRADVIVWPEGAIPGAALLEDPDALSIIGERLGSRVLIAGTVRRGQAPSGDIAYYNSAVVLDGVAGSLRLGQIYDKHHLVPFGEYLPFWELYSGVPLAPLQQIGRGFTPGPRPTRLIIPGAPPAAPLICYEAIFPGLAPRGEDRAVWLVNISIDSWYGKGTGPWQHANSARYRAIEEGLPLARAAAGGVSGVFDAFGRDVVATDLDGGAVQANLPPPIQPTLYSRHSLLLTIGALFFIGLLRFSTIGEVRRMTS